MLRVLFSVMLCIACNYIVAQRLRTVWMDGMKWILKNNTGLNEHCIEFSSGTITHTQTFVTVGKDEKITSKCNYYLSPTYPTEFNPSYIGRMTEGEYLVEYSGKTGTYKVFKVLKFENDSLILRYEDDPKKYIGGFEPIRKYKKVYKSKDGKEWK